MIKHIQLLFLTVFLTTLPMKAFADEAVIGLLYHITKSIQFPEPKNEMKVCVMGSEPDHKDFEFLNNDEGMPVVSVVFLSDASESINCQIVFVPRQSSAYKKKVIDTVKGKPILTVGQDDFAWAGGMISTYLVGGKLVFDINFKVLQSSGVLVDAKILELGRLINR